MKLKFDFRGFLKRFLWLVIYLVIPTVCAVIFGGLGWLLMQWPGGMAGAILTILLLMAAFLAIRSLSFGTSQTDQVQTDKAQTDQVQADQVQADQVQPLELSEVERQVLHIAIENPEYTDVEIQRKLKVNMSDEWVRLTRNKLKGKGFKVRLNKRD